LGKAQREHRIWSFDVMMPEMATATACCKHCNDADRALIPFIFSSTAKGEKDDLGAE